MAFRDWDNICWWIVLALAVLVVPSVAIVFTSVITAWGDVGEAMFFVVLCWTCTYIGIHLMLACGVDVTKADFTDYKTVGKDCSWGNLIWWGVLLVAVLAVPSFAIVSASLVITWGESGQTLVFIMLCLICVCIGVQLMKAYGLNFLDPNQSCAAFKGKKPVRELQLITANYEQLAAESVPVQNLKRAFPL